MLSEEEIHEISMLSERPEFRDAYEALRGVFHRAFLTRAGGVMVMNLLEVQPFAHALMDHPTLQKLISIRECNLLDEMVVQPWNGTPESRAMTLEYLSSLDALNLAFALAGLRPLSGDLLGDQKHDVFLIVRLFRAYGAVYRSAVMVREQQRLQDAAQAEQGMDDNSESKRPEVH